MKLNAQSMNEEELLKMNKASRKLQNFLMVFAFTCLIPVVYYMIVDYCGPRKIVYTGVCHGSSYVTGSDFPLRVMCPDDEKEKIVGGFNHGRLGNAYLDTYLTKGEKIDFICTISYNEWDDHNRLDTYCEMKD